VKRTRKAIVAAVAAATVALASVTVVGGSAGAQSSVRGVTDSEIVVGGLGYATLYSPAGDAAKARFDEANKNNELPGGRKIKYIGFTDDKSTTDVNLSEGRRLVDQEKVFAVVPVVTPFFQAGTYFNQAKVPAIGWGISPAYCEATNKYVFGFTGCLVPNPPTYPGNTWGELINKQLEPKGGAKGKSAAVISENNDSGKSGIEVIAATAEAVGMDVVYKEASMPAAPATVTDYSPFVQALMTADDGDPPDVIFLVVAQNNVFGLGRALKQAGYAGIQTNAVSYAPQLTTLADGWSAFTQFATPESASANMTKIVSTLGAAGISKDQIGQPALAGYFAADMFVNILKKAGKNLTPETFQKTAAKFKYEIADVIGPTVYPASFKAGAPCGQLATSNGTAWSVTAPFDCYNLLTKKGNKWVEVPYPSGVK